MADKEGEHLGCRYVIDIDYDSDMGPPWVEHDGHGPVSEWTKKEYKTPGQVILSQDRGSVRLYDWQEAMKIAKRDGWGLSDENKAELAKKLGKPVEKLTKGEITEAAVRSDFEYLRRWCNDEWHWVAYDLEVYSEDGKLIAEHSCCGFDGEDCCLSEAENTAKHLIARFIRGQLLTYVI